MLKIHLSPKPVKSSQKEIEAERKRAHKIVDEILDLKYEVEKEESKSGKFNGKLTAGESALKFDFCYLEKILFGWYYDQLRGAYCRFDHLGEPDNFEWDLYEHSNYDHKYGESLKEDADSVSTGYPMTFDLLRQFSAQIFNVKSDSRNPNAFIYAKLCHALKALNQGEVHSIVSPSKKGFKGNKYTFDFLRWISVLHVWAEWGIIGKKHLAQDIVASELNISKDQLISWEKSLSKSRDKTGRKRKECKSAATHYKVRKHQELLVLLRSKSEKNSYDITDLDLDIKLQYYRNLMLEYPVEKIQKLLMFAHEAPGSVHLEWTNHLIPKVILEP